MSSSIKHFAIFDVDSAESVLEAFCKQIGAIPRGNNLETTMANFESKWETLFQELDLNLDGTIARDELNICSVATRQLIKRHPMAAPIANMFNEMLLHLIAMADAKGPVSKNEFYAALQYVVEEHRVTHPQPTEEDIKNSHRHEHFSPAVVVPAAAAKPHHVIKANSAMFGTNEEEYDEDEEDDSETDDSETSSSSEDCKGCPKCQQKNK